MGDLSENSSAKNWEKAEFPVYVRLSVTERENCQLRFVKSIWILKVSQRMWYAPKSKQNRGKIRKKNRALKKVKIFGSNCKNYSRMSKQNPNLEQLRLRNYCLFLWPKVEITVASLPKNCYKCWKICRNLSKVSATKKALDFDFSLSKFSLHLLKNMAIMWQ